MKTGMPDFRALAEEAKDRISSVLPQAKKKLPSSGKFSFSRLKNTVSQKRGRIGTKVKSGINIPVVLHAALAVLICCGVLIAAGIGLYTVEQMEIHELRADLKAYSDDGVMPATYMNAALSLNVESLAGRVTSLKEDVGDGTGISTEQLQSINLQLIEIEGESEELSHLIANLHPDETVEKAFSENVQNPLYDLETVVENLIVNNDEISDSSRENGVANDTGSFKIGKKQRQLPWVILIVFGVILVLAIVLLILRRKNALPFFRMQKSGGKRKVKENPAGKRVPRSNGLRQNAPLRKTETVSSGVTNAEEFSVPEIETENESDSVMFDADTDLFADESAEFLAEQESVSEENDTLNAVEAEFESEPEAEPVAEDIDAIADENDPLAKLAPALRKFAEIEREKSAKDKNEGFMSYDENISSLEEIANDESDDLFALDEDDSMI